ncbi:MAG: hypothetical protein ACYDC3_03975 [Candidatus Binataceae bacterium]
MFRMTMMAVGVFAADIAAVAAIVGSMFLERWLGFSHRMFLDCIFVVAASYGVAAWFVGMWLKREMLRHQPVSNDTELMAVEAARIAISHHT